jgi:hypothetical protein
MSVFPNESHRKWIAVASLGLALYFLVMAALSVSDGNWLLGLLFLVLALALIGAELAKFLSAKGTSKDSDGPPKT